MNIRFDLVHARWTNNLQSGSTNSEDEDKQAGWKQLPYEEDGAEGQVAPVTKFTLQVSLSTDVWRSGSKEL